MVAMSTNFCVNRQWYMMPYETCYHVKQYCGSDKNADIIACIFTNYRKFRFGIVGDIIAIEPISYPGNWKWSGEQVETIK